MKNAPFYEAQLRPGAEVSTRALGSDRYRVLHDKGAEISIDEATAFLLEV